LRGADEVREREREQLRLLGLAQPAREPLQEGEGQLLRVRGGPRGRAAPGGRQAARLSDERLGLREQADEARRLLDEGVVDSADAIDLATVLGIGFPAFRGGLATFATLAGV
jgi:hypothetical protein